MASWVLDANSQEKVRTSIFPVSPEDFNNDAVRNRMKAFQEELDTKLKDRIEPLPPDDTSDFEGHRFERYEDDENEVHEMPEADHFGHEIYDRYILARIMLPQEDSMARATVIGRKRDADGELIGNSHPNPILDTGLYEVQFDDGRVDTYSANIIAENIFEQVDDEGKKWLLMDEIVDHRKTKEAISHEDRYFERNDKRYAKWTTKGWFLCVRWKDASTSWEESYPLVVAEYAEANRLLREPAFAWWAPAALRKRKRIIKQLKTRYHRRTEKFGLELPKTVKRALEIDAETGTDFWRKALLKEMGNIEPCMDMLAEGAQPPPGFQFIHTHIVFDIKMDFTRKVRFVANSSTTEVEAERTYASVVSRDSVRIALLYAALNDLDILSGDVAAAYLNAPAGEKVYFRCGPEFGQLEGRLGILTKALYGLKTSARAWRMHLGQVLELEMHFEACKADPDVWMRKATKEDGTEYYEFLLVYTDDILIVSHRPREAMSQLDQNFLVKSDSIGSPTTYLGAQVGTYRFPEQPDKEYWTLSSERYVKDAVRQVKEWMGERGQSLKNKAPSVLPSGYKPELDATDPCSDEDASYYSSVIGILRWAVELGRIDICTEVSLMASYMAAPRTGHLRAVLHIFAYLNGHDRSRLVFDAREFNHEPAQIADWTGYYPDAKEAIPPNTPTPLSKPMQMTCYIDSDHAGDLVMRRSMSGVLLYLNRSPIMWQSKKQASIETSTFGSEFMALKAAVEMIKGLRYKVRMMGIPLEEVTHVLVDNMSVVYNTTRPESTLKKKSNSIAYHYVRESAAAAEIKISHVESSENVSDMLTKLQTGPERKRLSQMVLY